VAAVPDRSGRTCDDLIVAVLIFAAFNVTYGRIYAPPVVAAFAQNSAAQQVGMQTGDRIVRSVAPRLTAFQTFVR
jgi:regulator of sigma E protease